MQVPKSLATKKAVGLLKGDVKQMVFAGMLLQLARQRLLVAGLHGDCTQHTFISWVSISYSNFGWKVKSAVPFVGIAPVRLHTHTHTSWELLQCVSRHLIVGRTMTKCQNVLVVFVHCTHRALLMKTPKCPDQGKPR